MDSILIQSVRFDERGLIPTIVQEAGTSAVVGLFYMDNDSLLKTLKSGHTYFRDAQGGVNQRQFRLVDVRVGADGGCLTVLVDAIEGEKVREESRSLVDSLAGNHAPVKAEVSLVDVGSMDFGITMNELYALIAERKEKRPEGSYTSYLFNSGLDKILKKIAEESGEVIIAAKNKSSTEIIAELSDLFYHLLVLMVERGVNLGDVQSELLRRSGSSPAHDDSGPGAHTNKN